MKENDIRGITVFFVVVVLLWVGYFYPRRPANQKLDIPAEQTHIRVEQYPQYKVVPGSVYDGDTIRVVPINVNGFPKEQQLKIRFACIDAPERKQPGGIEARDELKRLLESDGNRVKLNIVETDRYGRSVAEVWNGYGLVQSALAGSGVVYPYERYKSDCPNWDAVERASRFAVENKLGVWGNPNAVKPWDYRRNK